MAIVNLSRYRVTCTYYGYKSLYETMAHDRPAACKRVLEHLDREGKLAGLMRLDGTEIVDAFTVVKGELLPDGLRYKRVSGLGGYNGALAVPVSLY